MSNLELFIRSNYPKLKHSKELFVTCPQCKTRMNINDIIIKDFGPSEAYLCPSCIFIIATYNKHNVKDIIKDLSKGYTKEMFIGEEDIKILKDLGLKSKGENDDKEKH